MREADIEARLIRGVKALGGKAYKFVSPGHGGVPDRIVILPGGRIVFVELKTETGRLSGVQRFELGCLEALGCETKVLYGLDAVNFFLAECRKELNRRVAE